MTANVDFEQGRKLRVDVDAQFDRAALDILEHDLPIGRNYGPTDVPVIGTQGCDLPGRFDVNLVTVSEGQASRQGQNLIPVTGELRAVPLLQPPLCAAEEAAEVVVHPAVGVPDSC